MRDDGPIGVRGLRGVAELRRLDEVRAAARDWRHYSSCLIGDPDVRSTPQLPLEVDPPEHAAYRSWLEPILGRRAVATHAPQIRAIARRLIDRLAASGVAEAVNDLAVPLVAGSIAEIIGRPADADELASWGITSWEVGADGHRSGARLDAYVERIVAPGATGAIAGLRGSRIAGRAPTRAELVGVANLVLAGGRDTVILLLAARSGTSDGGRTRSPGSVGIRIGFGSPSRSCCDSSVRTRAWSGS